MQPETTPIKAARAACTRGHISKIKQVVVPCRIWPRRATRGLLFQSEGGANRLSYAGGCPSTISSPSAKVTQGCLLRVQICRVGRSHDVSSSVPALTRIIPSLGGLVTHDPHSGQTHRVLVRPMSAMRWSGRGSIPRRRKPVSWTTIPREKPLLVRGATEATTPSTPPRSKPHVLPKIPQMNQYRKRAS